MTSVFNPRLAEHRAIAKQHAEEAAHDFRCKGHRVPPSYVRIIAMVDLLDELLGEKRKGKR